MPVGVYVRTERTLASLRKAAADPVRRRKISIARSRHWADHYPEEMKYIRSHARRQKIALGVANNWKDPTHRHTREQNMQIAAKRSEADYKSRALKISKSLNNWRLRSGEHQRNHKLGTLIAAKVLREKGYKVHTSYDGIPDLIAIKNGKVLFGKYEGKNELRASIVWFGLTGKEVLAC